MKTPDFTNQNNDSELNDDAAWDLLKNASRTEAGPFFSRNVVREVRNLVADEKSGSGFFAWLRSPASALLGATAAIALLALALALGPGASSSPDPIAEVTTVEETEFNPTDELADVDYLGQLMAVADPAQLDDLAFAELF